jgi:hypothetical protein
VRFSLASAAADVDRDKYTVTVIRLLEVWTEAGADRAPGPVWRIKRTAARRAASVSPRPCLA